MLYRLNELHISIRGNRLSLTTTACRYLSGPGGEQCRAEISWPFCWKCANGSAAKFLVWPSHALQNELVFTATAFFLLLLSEERGCNDGNGPSFKAHEDTDSERLTAADCISSGFTKL